MAEQYSNLSPAPAFTEGSLGSQRSPSTRFCRTAGPPAVPLHDWPSMSATHQPGFTALTCGMGQRARPFLPQSLFTASVLLQICDLIGALS